MSYPSSSVHWICEDYESAILFDREIFDNEIGQSRGQFRRCRSSTFESSITQEKKQRNINLKNGWLCAPNAIDTILNQIKWYWLRFCLGLISNINDGFSSRESNSRGDNYMQPIPFSFNFMERLTAIYLSRSLQIIRVETISKIWIFLFKKRNMTSWLFFLSAETIKYV